jgi:hypothetical protein
VFASWGSLGNVTLAEPGAMIGFLGPRVYEALHGRQFPSGVQTAENLYHQGLVDAVCSPDELADIVARMLNIISPQCRPATVASVSNRVPDAVPAWIASSRPAWSEGIARRRCFAVRSPAWNGSG